MTAWNPNIPNPADVPATDAVAIQDNFSVIDTAFAQDHVNLVSAATPGFHKQISFPGAGSPPYSVAGTQNYTYDRLLASSVRSYLEYRKYLRQPQYQGINIRYHPINPVRV